ncbi:MAG: GNAT family N-acetyltransferase [Ahniella sp.]|nr:GNAT family N-acetyltransferase [Ahniella sp.]
MKELRPHLDLEQFLSLYAEAREEGYLLAGLFDSQELKCVAGYRYLTMLVRGKSLYVDDLVTTESGRSAGYGRLMLQWLEREAARMKCSELHLDSGVQRERAHRFYFAQGMTIKAYHFTRPLP